MRAEGATILILQFRRTLKVISLPGESHTKLHSNEFECKTPKFLKNRQSLIFQKLAGGGFASAIPI
ncbi:MAG: hypothetical protein LBP38_02770, partial [Desulfovibrio sp.]|nr:hypothetical protein [Desulfovibrio sp.]